MHNNAHRHISLQSNDLSIERLALLVGLVEDPSHGRVLSRRWRQDPPLTPGDSQHRILSHELADQIACQNEHVGTTTRSKTQQSG
eukprot:9079954-Alexandrium_andersonii.AAC.1